MKNLLPLKRLDLYTQLSAIILPWLYYFLMPGQERLFHLEHVVNCYFLTALVQVISCLVNKYRLPTVYKAKSRLWFQRCVMVLIIFVPACYMLNIALIALVVLLWTGPVLATWYMLITIAELRKIRRPIPIIDTEITATDL